MLKTAQGRHMMCVDGNLYRIVGKVISTNCFRWECIRRDIACKARVHTQSNNAGGHEIAHFANDNNHTHAPYSPKKLTRLLQKQKITILKNPSIKKPKSTAAGSTGSFEVINVGAKSKRASRSRATGDPFQMEMDASAAESYDDPLEALKSQVNLSKPLGPNEYTFLPSAKGNRVICLKNYVYHFDSRSDKNGRSYWTCTLRRDKIYKCNARLTTTMSKQGPVIIKLSGSHQHADCKDDIRRRLIKLECGENSMNKTTFYEEEMERASTLLDSRLERLYKGKSMLNESKRYYYIY